MRRGLAVRTIALLAAIGGLSGFGASQFVSRQYIGRTVVACSGSPCGSAAEATLSPESLKPIVIQSAYYRDELDYTPADEVVQRIRENASIRSVKAGAWRIEFIDADRYAAMEMAQTLAETMVKNVGPAGHVLEAAHTGQTGPGVGLCIVAGLLGGLTLGVAASAAARIL
jgi:hypothetical protein